MYAAKREIVELIRAFEDSSLARSEWTHAADLTIALLYLIHSPFTAVEKIRFGIQRYNHAHSIESTPNSGYHETITMFWIHLIQIYLNRVDVHDSLLKLTNQLINHYPDPNILLEYYSRGSFASRNVQLFSPLARST